MMQAAPRVHGGPDARGVAAHDFSTNANACGPCPSALDAVRRADPAHYPDPAYTALREQLAALHGVARWRIVPAASASEFIFRVTGWAARHGVQAVSVPRHAYGDYAAAAQALGLAVRHDAPAALAWACDPASPTGADAPMAGGAEGRIVVLDRAYDPLRLQGTSAWDAAALDSVWQLWSPNKALGLTGVRGGYVVAPLQAQDAARELESLAPSWPLGTHAVALLHAWCEPAARQWLAESRDRLRNWKARQLGLCRGLGWECADSVANFFCARPPAALPLHALRAHGVQLRDCASFGLAGWVRLGVLPPASQDALAAAVRTLETTQCASI